MKTHRMFHLRSGDERIPIPKNEELELVKDDIAFHVYKYGDIWVLKGQHAEEGSLFINMMVYPNHEFNGEITENINNHDLSLALGVLHYSSAIMTASVLPGLYSMLEDNDPLNECTATKEDIVDYIDGNDVVLDEEPEEIENPSLKGLESFFSGGLF
jgi:hypothetical protein